MKTNILMFTLCLSLSAYSQITELDPKLEYEDGKYVYTCNGVAILTRVADRELTSTEIERVKNEYLAIYGSLSNPNRIKPSDILSPATTKYNCHGYAWHMTEGHPNDKVWINDWVVIDPYNGYPNLQKYWSESIPNAKNECFIEIDASLKDYADKILYNINNEHSAIQSDSGKYISKWGWGPLIKHHPETVHYHKIMKYYIRKPTISGHEYVCSGGGTFTLNDPRPHTITWQLYPAGSFSFTPYPYSIETTVQTTGTGNHQVTVYERAPNGTNATLSAYSNAGTPNSTLIDSKTIKPCVPPSISGQYYICSAGAFSMNPGQTTVDTNQTQWSVTGTGFSLTKNTGKSTTVNVSSINGQTGTLTGTVGGFTCTYPLIADCEIIDDIIEIDGPESFCSSATFSIDGMPTSPLYNYTVDWTVKRKNNYYAPFPTYPNTQKSIPITIDYWEPDIFDFTAVVKDRTGTIRKTCTHSAYGGLLSFVFGVLDWSTASGQSGQLSMSKQDKIYFPPYGASDIVYINSYTVNGTVYYPKVRYSNAYFWSGCYGEEVDVSIVNNTTPNQLYITVPSDCEGCEGEIWINFYDDCGWGDDFYIPFEMLVPSPSSSSPSSFPSLAYPNPVSDILHIDIDQYKIEMDNVIGKSQQTINFDIRLYDGQGNMLRQTFSKDGTVQFNVSNLLNGIYYLHIYDGINDKPEMKQIVVQH